MKVRNIISLVFIMLLLILTGCNNNNNECLHTDIKWVITKEATCTTDGIKVQKCIRCNEVYDQQVIKSTNHDFSNDWTIDENNHFHKCLNCDEQQDITPHDYIKQDITLPTCEKEGNTIYQCLCGDVLKEEIVDAIGHNYQDGACTNCGDLLYQIETDYMYFGEYPQSLKEETVEIINKKPNEKGYYLGSDNNYYAKVEATPYSYLDTYFNNKTKIENQTYYFKVEPIKWQIIKNENNVYELVADLIIDNQSFSLFGNDYESSKIRNWLNNEFFNIAFNDLTKEYINLSFVKNNLESTSDLENNFLSESSYDKITLLSKEEHTNKTKQLTDYAKAKGCSMSLNTDTYNNGKYWLRTPSNKNSNYAYTVNPNGSINQYSNVDYTDIGVLPVLVFNKNQKCTTHTPSNWINDLIANCFYDGYSHTECTTCHQLLNTKITKGGHEITNYEAKSPTCTSIGWEAYETCKKCDYSTYVEIEALGHNYINGACQNCGDEIYKIEGNYIYFGNYPQTLKDDSVTITSDTPDSSGYYLGSDNNLYAKIKASPYSFETQYFNNNTSITNNTIYYFKVEPIKWQILEQSNGIYKLLALSILDNQIFDRSLNNYENSNVRNWLNNTFYNQAFNEKQSYFINTTLIDNSQATVYRQDNPYICNNTYDKVYLPSDSDMVNTSYGFNSNINTEDTLRQKQLTDYAKALGCKMNLASYYNCGTYWTRSPETRSDSNVSTIIWNGQHDICYSSDSSYGVVPSITINLNKTCTNHQLSNWIKDNDPTCTLNGYEHKECTNCKDILEIKTNQASHTPVFVASVAKTCVSDGNVEHYHCSVCSKNYKELSCTTEIIDVVTKASHELDKTERKEKTCTTDGNIEYYHCKDCNKYFTDLKATNEITLADTVIAKSHEVTHIEAVAKTCESNGNVEHYHCSVCNKNYKELSCTTEISNIVIQASHNLSKIEKIDKTCTTSGNIEYYKCSACNKCFTDSNATNEINESDTITNASHNLKHHDEKEATCTEIGWNAYDECLDCDYQTTYTEIEALNHNYINGICSRCNKAIYTIENNYIYFGEYPQTKSADSVTFDGFINTEGYYIGSDGQRYYKKDDTNYFKIEPIKWRILKQSNGVYTLISTIILDQHIYNSINYHTIDGKRYEANNYEYSDIRSWLTTTFFNKAFDTYSQPYINQVIVDNSLASTLNDTPNYLCNNTYDKIYLPSARDLFTTEYGFDDDINGSDPVKKYLVTDFAYSNGAARLYDAQSGCYWSRSPNASRDQAATGIQHNGDYQSLYNVYKDNVGVVPMINLNTNTSCETHTNSAWTKFNDATCEFDGYEYKECTVCHRITDTKITAASHDLENHVAVEATCTTAGNEAYQTCRNCSYTTFKEVEALGHNVVNGTCARCSTVIYRLDGNFVYFGEYPQSLKEDTVTITSETPDADGYYLGSDNQRYAKVVATPCDEKRANQVFHNGSKIVSGTTYYFKVEPIKWRILKQSNNEYTLYSEYVLDTQLYYKVYDGYPTNNEDIYQTNYEYSYIRKWLNSDFLNQAFDSFIQTYINTTTVDNSYKSIDKDNEDFLCNNTDDKIYLPSYVDLMSQSTEITQKTITDYAAAVGCEMLNTTYNGYIWTRSPNRYGSVYTSLSACDCDGEITSRFPYLTNIGVAPMLTATLS